MKKKDTWLLILMGALIFSCMPQPEEQKIDTSFFSQFIGLWKIEGENSFEEWNMDTDSSFHAISYSLEGTDTIIIERISVVEEAGKVYYEASVVNQNEGKPIRFRLTEYAVDAVRFVNKDHDFPQEISYSFFDKDHMKAVISGILNGQEKSYVFNYSRYMKKKKVTGVGGIFFKCEDPEKMKQWYNENLGLVTDEYGTLFEFRESDRPEKKAYLQWSPFSKNTDYFKPSEKDFMINYRVENMEELVEELKRSGVTVLDSIEYYDYGKFVHILDPENNKIELWEPVESDFTTNYEGKTTK